MNYFKQLQPVPLLILRACGAIERTGLNQLGNLLTTEAVIEVFENSFEPIFGRTLELASLDIIQERIKELEEIYYSDSWIKDGRV